MVVLLVVLLDILQEKNSLKKFYHNLRSIVCADPYSDTAYGLWNQWSGRLLGWLLADDDHFVDRRII